MRRVFGRIVVTVKRRFLQEYCFMPLYEYVCRSCQSEFELLIRGNETPECPACRTPDVQKRFSVPAAHSAASQSLPVCSPAPSAGCGLPQCGAGRCQFD
jgi:putative FmdB family regulatory protein